MWYPIEGKFARAGIRRSVVFAVLLGLMVGACGTPPPGGGLFGSADTVPSTSSLPSVIPEPSSGTWSDLVVEVVVEAGTGTTPTGRLVTERWLTVGDKTVRLAHQPVDGLGGALVPWVVPSFDGTQVFYTTWEDRRDLDSLMPGEVGGVPIIRWVDVAAGSDEEFRRGAYAPAVAPNGRVGFVEDLDGAYRFSVKNPTRVIVSSAAGEEVWSTETDVKYITMGWAGDHLIVYQMDEGEYLRTFVFDGPGQRRLLSDGGSVGAISPDGSQVLIVETTSQGSRFVIIRVVDGSQVASLDPLEQLNLPVTALYGGAWLGDVIVLPAVGGPIVLRYSPGGLVLDRVIELNTPGLVDVYPQLHLVDLDTFWFRMTTRAGDLYLHTEVVCELVKDRCWTVSPPVDQRSSAIVGNPSRGVGE